MTMGMSFVIYANSKGEFYEKISSYILVCRRIYQQLETFTSLSNAEKI